MSVIQNIESSKIDFSATDLKLAEFITGHLEEIPRMTSSDVAKESQTSPATVIRFARKMGFSKYSEFKLALSKDIEKRVSNEYSNISVHDSFETAKAKLLHDDKMVITGIEDLLDKQTVEKVVKLLSEIKKIYVYGVGTSVLAAEDVRQKWTRVGKTVIFDKDKYMLAHQMQNDSETCAFWGISHSGENMEVLSLVDKAKAAQIMTIGLTQIGQNQLAKQADLLIQTARTDNIDNGHYGSGATHSILLQLVTIDVLYYFYIRENFREGI